ncbi:MAG TPA: amino acid ABC transporter permease [Mycobacteriales bacterium]|nr:amino acid ABC transporter permease [Mycobacteriales bacterium]
MSTSVLYDVPGPRARRRTLIGSLVALVLLGLLLLVVVRRLADKGQFEADLYRPFLEEPDLYRRLGEGLRNTLKAAGYGLVLASLTGILLAFGRLAHLRLVRLPAVLVIEFFRATPLLLLIFAFFLAPPILFDVDVPALWALVLGLTLYNGAVIAEIVRAGILSLPSGQTEAALAIGLTRGQTMRTILLPQAVRIMLPALISQLVVLLKDTSLGFIVGFEELLRVGGQLRQFLDNPIQMYVAVALIYIVINITLGRVASWLEGRQRQRFGAVVGTPPGGVGMEQGGAPAA